jgi:hypothetical protein
MSGVLGCCPSAAAVSGLARTEQGVLLSPPALHDNSRCGCTAHSGCCEVALVLWRQTRAAI